MLLLASSVQPPDTRVDRAVEALQAEKAAAGPATAQGDDADDRVFTQEEFRAQLEKIDKKLRALPATAQVQTACPTRCLPTTRELQLPHKRLTSHEFPRLPVSL